MANSSTNNFSEIFITSKTAANGSSLLPVVGLNHTVLEIKEDRLNITEYFVSPVVLVFGILGNLCTILTISHVQFRHMTSRYILYALAISDSVCLLTNQFQQQPVKDIFEQDVRALSRTGCQLFYIIYISNRISSSWFVVLIDIERFIAVLFPLKVRLLITKKVLFASVSVIYILPIILTGCGSFSTDIVNGTCKSDATTPNNLGLHNVFRIALTTCYSIAPMILLSTLTPPIISKLFRSQRRRQDMNTNNRGNSANDTFRVSVMLIGVVVTYVICLLPMTVTLFLTVFTNEPVFTSQRPDYITLVEAAFLFEQVNHSVNFLVYIMCCREFRERFFHMIKCSGVTMTRTESSIFVATTEQKLQKNNNE